MEFLSFFIGYALTLRIDSPPEPTKQFIVDRPFFYLLFANVIYMDDQNDTFDISDVSLFNGRVSDPER